MRKKTLLGNMVLFFLLCSFKVQAFDDGPFDLPLEYWCDFDLVIHARVQKTTKKGECLDIQQAIVQVLESYKGRTGYSRIKVYWEDQDFYSCPDEIGAVGESFPPPIDSEWIIGIKKSEKKKKDGTIIPKFVGDSIKEWNEKTRVFSERIRKKCR